MVAALTGVPCRAPLSAHWRVVDGPFAALPARVVVCLRPIVMWLMAHCAAWSARVVVCLRWQAVVCSSGCFAVQSVGWLVEC